MPRVLRYALALAVIILTAALASAQPTGGGGQVTPTPPASRPPVIEDFQDILNHPDDLLAEILPVIQSYVDDFLRENRARVEANLEALQVAVKAGTTRALAVVLGVLLLAIPNKTKYWAWLFLGAVLGLIVTQIPLGDQIRLSLSNQDLRFLLQEPQGTLALIGLGAIAGLVVLSPLFYLTMTVAGSAAGSALAFQLAGGNPGIAAPALAVGGFIGFVIMAYALSRGGLLVPLAIGGGLIVFALGFPALWILPLMLLGGLFAFARSAQGKKRLMPTLTLQEGKVNVAHDKRDARQHLHEILPTMADDRDNPLIKR